MLPDNCDMCHKQLVSLTRLEMDDGLCLEHEKIIKDQIESGVVEVVTDHSEQVKVGEIHYIAHHPVIRPDKDTTKVRIVYDASARSGGPSLNDCLYVGPPLTQEILDVLLRFRVHGVALAGDIEKAFLMVSVAPEDRDALRFLWWDDLHSPQRKVQVLRFTHVVFGVTFSPFLLNATVRHYMQQFADHDPEFVQQFLRSLYVDDLNTGANDVEHGYDTSRQS